MARLGEFEAIAALQRALAQGAPSSRRISVSNGDDAAGLRSTSTGQHWLWSIDSSAEGVHFDLRWLTLGQAAARAYVAALSDLAAMGAKPVAALCALTVPAQATRKSFNAIGKAQAHVGKQYACPVVGGNVCRGDRWAFHTTVLGTSASPLLRSGARAGDEIWLVGALGEAAAGLSWLQSARAPQSPPLQRAVRHCVNAWREPQAHIAAGLRLARTAHSQIDVSDGLASEARHLAQASGVRLLLSETQLRQHCSPALRLAAAATERDELHYMLYGGEDYALLATGPAAKRPRAAHVIGSVTRGRGAYLDGAKGLRSLSASYDHLKQR